ncbi:MAG: hypothetical protein IPJ88_11380 [Myxococcales bacterium]|nr:MAG: hypothetical protein IPJ88_11380 [Myxococcales bacterium]
MFSKRALMRLSVVVLLSLVVSPALAKKISASSSAIELFDAGKFEDAAIALRDVVDGKVRANKKDTQKAEFYLGMALFNLKFYQSSLTLFDQIVATGDGHPYFDETLVWLAKLASALPESAGIIEKVGQYDVAKLDKLKDAKEKGLYGHVVYLMGRFKYQQEEFDEALSLFGKVQKKDKFYAQAKLFEGITHVRLRHARPAIASFRAVIDAEDSGDLDAGNDEERLVDLAWLSLARVYYKASNKVDEATGEFRVDGRVLGNAVEAWNKIEPGSEYWLDAMFEGSWAFFLADEYSRALGNIHTLLSPYFDKNHYPEAYVLKAVVFFYNCQMENASAMVERFHELYDPVQNELEGVLAQNTDNLKFYDFLKAVRAGEANLSPRIQSIVYSALSDRQILRHLEYIRLLDEEEGRLKSSSKVFQSSAVGQQILQDVALGKSFAVDQAGDLARARYDRVLAELQDLMNQVDTVDVEVLSYTRGQLSQDMQNQQLEASRSGRGDVEVDEEHQVWPFDGEYWRDELGFYRQQVTSRCGR